MSTTATKPDRARPIASADISDDEIAKLKTALAGRKLRKGCKHVINTGDPEATEYAVTACPIIEVWFKERRMYLPLSFSTGWHFTTSEERDAVLARLNAA